MENHWQELWNNRKINFAELSAEDESRLILELKRIVGWDFHGKKSSVSVDEFRKEYRYIKDNLDLRHGGSMYLRLVAAQVRIYISFVKDGFKVGGLDYAENLLNIAKQVIGADNLTVKFDKHHMENFCNEPFNFDCFLYKR